MEETVRDIYPPCVKPLLQLQPILLDDLTTGLHHAGKVLVVKPQIESFGEPYFFNVIEDASGSHCLLSVSAIARSPDGNTHLPKGAIIAIKEPICSVVHSGATIVTVQQPSNIIKLQPDHELVPSRFAPQSVGQTESAMDMNEKGNVAVKRKDWFAAFECYSEALGIAADHELEMRRTFYRNRAMTNFYLGRHEAALADALKSILLPEAVTSVDLGHFEVALADAIAAVQRDQSPTEAAKYHSAKACYRAGLALYGLAEYAEAEKCFTQVIRLQPHDKGAPLELKRCQARLREQSGRFDLAAMRTSANANHRHFDHASFTQNARIEEGQYGRGLIATKSLRPGDVVMVEKAFFITYAEHREEVSGMHDRSASNARLAINKATLVSGLVHKLLWAPREAEKFLSLYNDGKIETQKPPKVDGVVALDVFQVQAIAGLNAFECPELRTSVQSDDVDGAGIWYHASFFNHSCLPNCAQTYCGDMMIVRACKNIKKGEQLFLGYRNPYEPWTECHQELKEAYHFECTCLLCQANCKSEPTLLTKRADLWEEAADYISVNPPSGPPAAITQRVEHLYDQLATTYDNKLFSGLPRVASIALNSWLSAAYASTRSTDIKGLKAFLTSVKGSIGIRTLRDLGYIVKPSTEGRTVSIDRTNGLPVRPVLLGAMLAATRYAVQGRKPAADVLHNFAREMQLTMDGDMDDFDDRYHVWIALINSAR